MTHSLKPSSLKMPLRYRFVIYFTLLIFFLMIFVILIVEKRERNTLLFEVKKRVEAVAGNLAAVSTMSLVTYNYITLKQNAEKVARDEDVVYVIILDKEGNVAAYSGHDEKQGQRLDDAVSLKAWNSNSTVTQEIFDHENGIRILETAVPVYIEGSEEKWGLIRLGFSLESIYADIAYTRVILILIGLSALILGCVGSVFLSRRITRPMEDLVKATVEVANGNLDQKIDINTGDEIEDLSVNFNVMIREVLSQRREIESRYEEILLLKRYTDHILFSMTNGLLTIDSNGAINTVNRSGEGILGVKSEMIAGKKYEKVFAQNPLFVSFLKEAILKGVSNNSIEQVYYKEGRRRMLALNLSPLLDGKGLSIGTLLVFEDLTEIKELEEKMRHADRLAATGTIAASLAHEIRNPLTAIKTFVQLMPVKFNSESFRKRFDSTVPREINRIIEIIDALLDLSRKPKIVFADTELNEVINESLGVFAEEMTKRQIRYKLNLEDGLPFIKADREMLKRVFSNLIINALQAMPCGGMLDISTGTTNKGTYHAEVFCILKDTGVGMNAETVENLFNPFYTTKDKGTGLGLAIVKKIIDEHKAGIEVTSSPDMGSAFRISFSALQKSCTKICAT